MGAAATATPANMVEQESRELERTCRRQGCFLMLLMFTNAQLHGFLCMGETKAELEIAARAILPTGHC